MNAHLSRLGVSGEVINNRAHSNEVLGDLRRNFDAKFLLQLGDQVLSQEGVKFIVSCERMRQINVSGSELDGLHDINNSLRDAVRIQKSSREHIRRHSSADD